MAINVYDSEDFPPLHSAIRDAFRAKNYLTDLLGVPESQIRMLIGSDASRYNIIEALKSFQEDQRIERGDPIFIFFAGHGNEILAPPSWISGDQSYEYIQALVPQNYCSIRGLEVPCIPDRTVGALLKAIAEKKGKNITVVLDCCHSASGTRGPGNNRFRSGTKPSLIRTEDLDRDIWGSDEEVSYPAPRFQHDGLFSHTLIAACGPSELAAECDEYGRFSNAFLNLLKVRPPDEIRYSQILGLMDPIKGQNPQIEGVDLDRFLFDAAPHIPLPPAHHVLIFDRNSDSHFIAVGTAHGVTSGTIFDVKSDSGLNAVQIGTLTVQKSMSFHSLVKSCNDSPALPTNPRSTVAVVQRKVGVRPHPLGLYIAREGNNGARYQASHQYLRSLLDNIKYNLHNVVLVDKPEKAHFKVSVSRSKATFQLLDKRLTHCNRYFRLPLSSDKIALALEAASDFRWDLDRTNEDDSDLMNDIAISVYPLRETDVVFANNDILTEMMPINDKDLCENNELDIVVRHDQHLGFKITNTGDRGLYPVLQYFEFSDLGKITILYQPPISGPYLLEAPLKEDGGSLTVGYGAGGMPPLTLNLQQDQDLTIGYLKLSVFTRPLDLRLVGTRFDQRQNQHHDRSEDTWATRVIPVIQRRHPVQTPVVTTALSSRWPSMTQRSIHTYPEAMVTRSISTPAQSTSRLR